MAIRPYLNFTFYNFMNVQVTHSAAIFIESRLVQLLFILKY